MTEMESELDEGAVTGRLRSVTSLEMRAYAEVQFKTHRLTVLPIYVDRQ